MKKLKVAYFGSPDFAADFLEKVLAYPKAPVEIVQVVTPKDKPAGRKGEITAVPVKKTAQRHNIPVIHSPQELRDDIDLVLLFAYGEIIPPSLLSKPKYGFWNIHPSLLPLYRGPSPMATPIIEGKSTTGVTLMKMDEQIDHGPIIGQLKTDILPEERHPQLAKRLSDLGAELFMKSVGEFMENNYSIKMHEQDHAKATFTKTFTKQDGFIDSTAFSQKPQEVFNRFRGLSPWPGIWTRIKIKGQERRLKITDMSLEDGKPAVIKVQLEGKQEVDYTTFCKAYGKLIS